MNIIADDISPENSNLKKYFDRNLILTKQREKKIFVPQLQSFLAKFIICYEDIIAILNPEEDWDNDTSHLYNERLSSVELKEYSCWVEQNLSPKSKTKYVASSKQDLLTETSSNCNPFLVL